jgi:hypothetical protein
LNFIDSILIAEPGLYLDEIQDKLRTFRDVEVSIATISRTLSRLDITNKHIAKEAIERNELLRATWQIEMTQYGPRQIVFIDKAGVNDHTNVRRKGWAPLGQACVRRTSFLQGQKYSILPALGLDGILALDIFEGSVNRERFIAFLRDHLVRLFHDTKVCCCVLTHVLGSSTQSFSNGEECGGDGQLFHSP